MKRTDPRQTGTGLRRRESAHLPVLAALGGALLTATSPALGQGVMQRLDQLDARISRLEDLDQVERVQRTYGYFVDKSQWHQLAELFTDDATLEIGGKGIFLGKARVLEYMLNAFGPDGVRPAVLANHMQFQPVTDISADGMTAWNRSRAYVMASGGWGLPLYENEYRKGSDGKWRISRLTGPFTMYTGWTGWAVRAGNTTWPDKFPPPPDLPPSIVTLMYPSYFIVPYHYPNPVTGEPFVRGQAEVGSYAAPPGTPLQQEYLRTGRMADGTQPIAEPPRN